MNKKILIIDDEEDTRFLLKRALTSHNYTVAVAANLKQGLDSYNLTEPDIVIMDVNLPDGNGIYYARKFKTGKNIIIFVSADNDKLVDGYREVGGSGFLKKPFAVNQLLKLIDQV